MGAKNLLWNSASVPESYALSPSVTHSSGLAARIASATSCSLEPPVPMSPRAAKCSVSLPGWDALAKLRAAVVTPQASTT
jgi:hypothetical protein